VLATTRRMFQTAASRREPVAKRRSPGRKDEALIRGDRTVATPHSQTRRPAAGASSGDDAAQPPWAAALINAAAKATADDVEKRLADRISKLELVSADLSSRVTTVEQAQKDLKEECKSAATQAALAAVQGISSGPGGAFRPSSIDIRGPCDFTMVDKEGFTREFIEGLSVKLTKMLPDSLQASVGGFALRGLCAQGVRGCSASFEVLNAKRTQEIAGIWTKKLRFDAGLHYTVDGKVRELYATVERSEAERLRYRTFGKTKEAVEALRRGSPDLPGTLNLKWKPAFAVKNEDEVTVAWVNASATLECDDALVRKYLGVDARGFRKRVTGGL
jgi:hypothetical protein